LYWLCLGPRRAFANARLYLLTVTLRRQAPGGGIDPSQEPPLSRRLALLSGERRRRFAVVGRGKNIRPTQIDGEPIMLVKEVMSTKLETVAPATTIRECAGKMDQLGVGVLPVWQNGKPAGVITDRDICCRVVAAGKDPATTTVRQIMTGTVACCFDDQDCADAARLMKNEGVRRLTVMDRKQTMVGVLSVDDLARCSHGLAGEVLDAVAPWPH
jgi:CBS domain-containing protein